MVAKPKIKKEPITPEMLLSIVESFILPTSLTELRLGCVCLLAYAAFIRIEEVRTIHCCDVIFTPDGMEFNITRSKTDQFRQNSIVPM